MKNNSTLTYVDVDVDDGWGVGQVFRINADIHQKATESRTIVRVAVSRLAVPLGPHKGDHSQQRKSSTEPHFNSNLFSSILFAPKLP